jgi:fructuronate reductase
MGSRHRLSERTLREAMGCARPGYDRKQVTAGIVHLGVGAFHRAHQAVYVDDCIAAGETGWGIVGVSLRSPDTRDALGPQDVLYTLAVQDSSGEKLRIVGSELQMLVAPENPAHLVARLADPAIRIVTLTVTEKAYLRNASGGLDLSHADIVSDLANPESPRTVHGFIVAALAKRRAAGVAPFTVLCCDNLPDNGGTVRRLVIEFAAARDAALARHIESDVAFPSTMVDRIVPATTDADRERISALIGLDDAWPVKTEPFMQWVVEDHFPSGRPGWEKFGVEMVKDVRPYEEMKLRLLNGSHSGMAYLGLLCGRESISDAFADPDIRGFVDRLWGEAIPTLPRNAGLDPEAYTRALAKRYSNTALVHRTAQIAMDGSQKLPQRIVTTSRTQLEHGRRADNLMLVAAAWIAACEARGNSLPAGHFNDPLDAKLAEIFARKLGASETVRAVFAAAGFSVASAEDPLPVIAAAHLETIRAKGARAAIEAAARMGTAA